MFDWITNFHPVTQALLATLFTWAMTALGAGDGVFLQAHRTTCAELDAGLCGGSDDRGQFLVAAGTCHRDERGHG